MSGGKVVRLQSQLQAGEVVGYRPSSQHTLHALDDMYDMRQNAYLRCYNFIWQLYEAKLVSHHRDLFSALQADYNKVLLSSRVTVRSSSRTVPVSFVSTSLSDPDRQLLVQCSTKSLCGPTGGRILHGDVSCHASQSAHDLLVEAATNVHKVFHKLTNTRQRQAGSNMTQKLSDLMDHIVDQPLHVIEEVLAALRAGPGAFQPVMVLNLHYAERLEQGTFGGLLTHLAMSRLKVVVVAFHSSCCPLPMRLDHAHQPLLDASLHASAAAWSVYDDLMGEALAAKAMPMSMPPSLVLLLHEGFFRSHACIRTAVDRLLFCVSEHFLARASILCMHNELGWIEDMTRGGGQLEWRAKNYTEGPERQRAALVHLRDHLVCIPHFCQVSSVDYFRSVAGWSVKHLCYKLLMDARDSFLRGRERRNFSSDIMWAAISLEKDVGAGGKKKNNFSGTKRQQAAMDAKVAASPMVGHIAGSRLCPEDERKAGDEARSALELVVVELMRVLGAALRRAPLKSVYTAMLGWREILAVPKGSGISAQPDYLVSLNQLGQRLQEEIDLLDTMLEQVVDQCPAGADPDKLSAAALARLAVEAGKAGSEAAGDDEPSVHDLAEYSRHCMTDVAAFLDDAVTSLRLLPWAKIEGALHMDPRVMAAVKRQTAGTMRVDFVRSLLEPELFLDDRSGHEVWPDVSALHMQVNNTDRSKAVYEWFDLFQEEQQEEGESGRPHWKKVKLAGDEGVAAGTGYPLEVKGRFAAAVTTLEHHGLIRVTADGKEVQRQMFAWDSFT